MGQVILVVILDTGGVKCARFRPVEDPAEIAGLRQRRRGEQAKDLARSYDVMGEPDRAARVRSCSGVSVYVCAEGCGQLAGRHTYHCRERLCVYCAGARCRVGGRPLAGRAGDGATVVPDAHGQERSRSARARGALAGGVQEVGAAGVVEGQCRRRDRGGGSEAQRAYRGVARSVRTSDTHPGRIAGRGTVVDGLFRAGSSVRTNGSEENCGRRAEA